MRLFVALWPPEPVLEALRSVSRQLARVAANPILRPTRPEQWHLTLRFLGEVEDAPETRASLDSALQKATETTLPFPLRLGKAGCFPETGRPRVLWVGLVGNLDALGTLQRRTAEATDRFVRHPETGRFHPHLTLARVSEPFRSLRKPRSGPVTEPRNDGLRPTSRVDLREVMARLTVPEVDSWTVNDLSLVQSALGPNGAAYTTIGTYPLGRPA